MLIDFEVASVTCTSHALIVSLVFSVNLIFPFWVDYPPCFIEGLVRPSLNDKPLF